VIFHSAGVLESSLYTTNFPLTPDVERGLYGSEMDEDLVSLPVAGSVNQRLYEPTGF